MFLRASCDEVPSSAMLRALFFFFFYLMLDDLIDARLDFMRGMEKKKDGKRFVRGVKTKRKFFEGNHWVDL